MKKTIIFLHIQKTSGSTVNEMMRLQPNKVFWYKRPGKPKPNFISGHVPFGIHKDLKLREYSYFTFIRDPIERFKSQVYHGLRSKKSLGNALIRRNGGLKGLLEFCLKTQSSMDIMTKQLSGMDSKTNAKLWKWEGNMTKKKDFGYWQVFGWSGRKSHYKEDEMEKMLEAAKSNLHQCDFIGIQEKGSVEHNRLANFYGMRKPPKNLHVRKSVRTEKLEWNEPEIIDMLNMLNRYDLELYKYVNDSL